MRGRGPPCKHVSACWRARLTRGDAATGTRRSRSRPRLDVARANAESSVHLGAASSAQRTPRLDSNWLESNLGKRIAAGVALGAAGTGVLLSGGLPYLAFIELFAYLSSREYIDVVRAVWSKEARSPLPEWGTWVITLCCLALPFAAFGPGGHLAMAMALVTFGLLATLTTLARGPSLSTLTAASFGLLYCGFLPAYWVKLRSVAVPAVHTQVAQHWPALLGGVTHVSVGLVATFTTIACIVAADIGAYVVGQTFGRTPLSSVSPGKTVEGALGGFVSTLLTAGCLHALLQWPRHPVAALGLAVLVFGASVLGDLIESVMKRDAGVKDIGSAIPGHGGVLDRFDSFVFTGAVVFVYLECLQLFGV